MPDCLFCKIIAGEIQTYKVYEDGQVLAILDIAPVNPGHILVIPKQHFANFEELPESEINAIFTVVKKLGQDLKTKLNCAGYNVNQNNDPIAGQVIPHFHVHIVPRRADDGLKLWPGHEYKAGEAEIILTKLINN